MNKIYLAGYFRQNFGDDLFVKAFANHYPSSDITILVEPEFSHVYDEISNIKTIKYTFFKRILNKLMSLFGKKNFFETKIIAQNDIIVEIGGSIFQQASGEEDITFRRKSYIKTGKPIFIIGSNFGPYYSESYFECYWKYFSVAKGVVFRDVHSFNLFKQLPNVTVAPDVVLGLTISNSDKIVFKSKKKKIAVISVINVSDKIDNDKSDILQNKYDEKIKNLIESLIELNYDVTLFGFSQAERDIVAANRIKSTLPTRIKNNVSIKLHENIDDSIKIMKNADILFSSRFHSMILGWKLQIPQYVFMYSKKTENVIKDLFPLQSRIDVQHIDTITVDSLVTNANTMDKDVLAITEKNAMKQFELVDDYLKSEV